MNMILTVTYIVTYQTLRAVRTLVNVCSQVYAYALVFSSTASTKSTIATWSYFLSFMDLHCHGVSLTRTRDSLSHFAGET